MFWGRAIPATGEISANSVFSELSLMVDLEAPRTRLVVRVLGAGSDGRVGKGSGSKRSNGSIRVQKHARGCGLRADESEFARLGAVRKEALACAQQDRVDEQQNFVDQPLHEQHGREGRASPDDQVSAVLRFDAAKTLHDIRAKVLDRAPSESFPACGSRHISSPRSDCPPSGLFWIFGQ